MGDSFRDWLAGRPHCELPSSERKDETEEEEETSARHSETTESSDNEGAMCGRQWRFFGLQDAKGPLGWVVDMLEGWLP